MNDKALSVWVLYFVERKCAINGAKEMPGNRCHYFEKNRVFKANLMLMNNEAWDNIEEILRDFGKRIKRNNWGDSENDGRGKIP